MYYFQGSREHIPLLGGLSSVTLNSRLLVWVDFKIIYMVEDGTDLSSYARSKYKLNHIHHMV